MVVKPLLVRVKMFEALSWIFIWSQTPKDAQIANHKARVQDGEVNELQAQLQQSTHEAGSSPPIHEEIPLSEQVNVFLFFVLFFLPFLSPNSPRVSASV